MAFTGTVLFIEGRVRTLRVFIDSDGHEDPDNCKVMLYRPTVPMVGQTSLLAVAPSFDPGTVVVHLYRDGLLIGVFTNEDECCRDADPNAYDEKHSPQEAVFLDLTLVT